MNTADTLVTEVITVALLVVGIGLSLGGPTGYAIDPARDLGPRTAHALLPIPNKGGADWGYSWPRTPERSSGPP
jgi:glycerol uptake facilitator protein